MLRSTWRTSASSPVEGPQRVGSRWSTELRQRPLINTFPSFRELAKHGGSGAKVIFGFSAEIFGALADWSKAAEAQLPTPFSAPICPVNIGAQPECAATPFSRPPESAKNC